MGAAVLTILPEGLGYLGVGLEALLRAAGLPAPPELMALCHDLEVVIFGAILMVVMIVLPRGLVRGVMDLWEMRKFKFQGSRFKV